MNLLKGRTLIKGKILRNTQKLQMSIAGAKVGATSGWTVNTALDTAYANLPASQTSSTLIIPLPPMKPGTVITGFCLNGGLTSVGGAVTLDADLRKQTPASGAVPTDASVGTMTQLSKTASAVIGTANARKTGLTETVVEGVGYYLKLTGTTAASTAENITSVTIEYNEAA